MSKHWYIVDWNCCLGAGGEGEVYLGRCVETGALCAVKVSTCIHPAQATQQLSEELARCRRAAGEGSVGLVAWNLEDARPFLVFELAQAGTLADEVRALREAGRVYHPVAALERLRQILSSLAKVHARGVVHRDVKPANLLRFGDALKLTDFGAACSAPIAAIRERDARRHGVEKALGQGAAPTTTATEPGAPLVAADEAGARDLASALQAAGSLPLRPDETADFVGTRLYAAPEQLRGEPADVRADLYATGCILHEMLTGRPPPASGQLRTRRRYPNALVLPIVDDLLTRLLADEPAERPPGAEAALRAVDAALGAYADARAAWTRLELGPSPY